MAGEYVVVGGSKGIGLGLVKRLTQQGHKVTVLSRSADELASMPGVVHHAVDVTQETALETDCFPEQIAGLAYCPGSLNLRSFRSLKPEVFRQDFEIM